MNITAHPNVIAADPDAATEGLSEFSPSEKDIVEKVVHTLEIYPRLSWSHLQVSMGTALPPSVWKPVVLKMQTEGIVSIDHKYATIPNGRTQSYTIISLAAR